MANINVADIKVRLDRCTNAQLVVVYNLASERHVSKFSDHSTAVARTASALEKIGQDFRLNEDETVSLVEIGTLHPDTRIVTVLSEANPKAFKSKSHARFALYRTGMTVGDYIEAVKKHGRTRRVAMRDIDWDLKHGYISLSVQA